MVLWREDARAERMRWLQRELRQLLDDSSSNAVYLQIVESTSAPPDAETREVAKAIVLELSDRVPLVVTVPLGDSIWQSVVRTMLRLLLLVSGMGRRHIVVTTFEQACGVIEARATDSTPDAAALGQTHTRLQAALD